MQTASQTNEIRAADGRYLGEVEAEAWSLVNAAARDMVEGRDPTANYMAAAAAFRACGDVGRATRAANCATKYRLASA